MRLLLYGGTFDPPHNGHLNNLRAAAARVRPDRVVVMPAGLSPFKQSTAAPGSARVEMCACFRALEAEGAVPALCVSGWEVEQAALGRRNYTVLTLEMLARTEWGVEDEAVLSAIACHTAGKPGMSRLDKIVYLADMTSAERDWPGVNKLRRLELKDLDLAMLAALRQTNDFVLSQGKPLDPMSKAAYDEIKAEVDARAAKAG